MKTRNFTLQRVRFIPDTLEPGVLYVAEKYKAVHHLCACGCGETISTPLGPTEWSFEETRSGPSLFPSVGNWQKACKSHYWIRGGRVECAPQWSEEQILAGRSGEEARRRAYYSQKQPWWWQRLWRWLKSFFT
jgi:hypothetical protein